MSRSAEFVPFEPVEHTADLAFLARGRTYEELFENAASAMLHFLYDRKSVQPAEIIPIEVGGEDLEGLLIAWLQEILYLQEVHGLLFHELRVTRVDPSTLTAVGRGERRDPARHSIHTDIKAATYHGLEIRQETTPAGTIYWAQVVLDI